MSLWNYDYVLIHLTLGMLPNLWPHYVKNIWRIFCVVHSEKFLAMTWQMLGCINSMLPYVSIFSSKFPTVGMFEASFVHIFLESNSILMRDELLFPTFIKTHLFVCTSSFFKIILLCLATWEIHYAMTVIPTSLTPVFQIRSKFFPLLVTDWNSTTREITKSKITTEIYQYQWGKEEFHCQNNRSLWCRRGWFLPTSATSEINRTDRISCYTVEQLQ